MVAGTNFTNSPPSLECSSWAQLCAAVKKGCQSVLKIVNDAPCNEEKLTFRYVWLLVEETINTVEIGKGRTGSGPRDADWARRLWPRAGAGNPKQEALKTRTAQGATVRVGRWGGGGVDATSSSNASTTTDVPKRESCGKEKADTKPNPPKSPKRLSSYYLPLKTYN
jgi:hypothetical protein